MHDRYRKTRFLTSAHEPWQLPPDNGREVAFAGRSNAGKSSALNLLTRQRNLARTSKTPGRTQLINFFEVEPGCCLVDLPGYGYAKVPETLRLHWRRLVEHYLNSRQALRGLILLMDVRHPLTDLDRSLLAWCARRELPCHVLLTKADKLKRGPALATLQQVRQALRPLHPPATVQLFSALDGLGAEEALARLDYWLGYSKPAIPDPAEAS
jgi:GTP-binding protein